MLDAVEVTQTSTSQLMEKYGFGTVFDGMLDAQVNIAIDVANIHDGRICTGECK